QATSPGSAFCLALAAGRRIVPAMIRALACALGALALTLPCAARAEPGVYLDVGWGWTFWSMDRARVADQVAAVNPGEDVGNFFDASLQNAQAADVGLGYNILGYVHVGARLLGSGWNITTGDRGGAGYVGGVVGVHPIAVWMALSGSSASA